MSTSTSAAEQRPVLALRTTLREQRRDAAEGGAHDHRRSGAARRQRARHRSRVGGEIGRRIGTIVDPGGIAMTALVQRIGDPARGGELLGGRAPGMAGLAAAMEQQHDRPLLAIDVGDEPVAAGTGEQRDGRLDRGAHGRSSRNASTPSL